ncbi:MAG: hypothetical protein EPO58_04265 [Chitinophagaceae bacterium]|nr:MAG: hypothetical protein EPO58_04265 [Chitinophagaceae bacterium]
MFHKIVITCRICILLIVSYQPLFAQTFDSILAKAQQKYPDGSIYCQSNKQHYTIGETIYLKAYLKSGSTKVGSNIKFELLKATGDVITEFTGPILSQTTVGTLQIPENILEGRYFIICYTDAASAYKARSLSYVQAIMITSGEDPDLQITAKPYYRESHISWKFENNKLFEGIENNIYYLSRDQFGYPQKTSAFILNARKDTICAGQSDDIGTGKLFFTPEAGQKYQVGFMTSGDTTISVIKKETEDGVSLSAYLQDDAYVIETKSTRRNTARAKHLIGIHGLNKVFEFEFQGTGIDYKVRLPIKDLQNGIITLLLFDGNQNVLAEKSIFVYAENSKLLNQTLSNLTSPNIDSISLAKELNNSPIEDAGISVVSERAEEFFSYPLKNITESLLLLNFLKQPLVLPKDYFDSITPISIQKINTVLASTELNMLQAEQLFENRYGPDSKKEIPDYLEIYVRRKENKKSSKVNNLSSIFVDKTKSKDFYLFQKDSGNIYSLRGAIFFDTVSIYFTQGAGSESFNPATEFILDSVAGLNFTYNELWTAADSSRFESPIITHYKLTKSNSTSGIKKHIQDSSRNLNEVTVVSTITLRQKTKLLDKRYTKGLFSGQANKVLDLVNEPYGDFSLSIWNYIMISHPNTIARSPIWTYYLNEGIVSREELTNIPVKDVALVKIFLFGMAGQPSIVVYTKKTEDLPGQSLNTNNKPIIRLAGYSTAIPFIEETTNNSEERNIQISLQWVPNLNETDLYTSLQKVNQKNTKIPRKTSILIQGILVDGNSFFFKKYYPKDQLLNTQSTTNR